MSTNHTLRPVIDELRAAQQSPFPQLEWPEPGPDGGLVGVEPDALTRHLSSPQASALEARLYAGDRTAITDDALWEDPQPRITPLPIGMVEPPEPPPMADERFTRAADHGSLAPWVFWALAALALGLIVARAEGWL